jgi:hypothetical protein
VRVFWRLLLRLYPREHRLVFSAEMLAVILNAGEEQRAHGALAYARFAVRECWGLLRGAGRERFSGAGAALAYAAPVTGGIAAASGFQAALYLATARASHLAAAAVERANLPADQRVAGLTVGVFGVAALVCLLPVFFLLSTHLRRGRR